MAVNKTQSTAEGSSVPEPGPSTISLASVDPANVITKEDIERKPWKYVGYRAYTKLVASEDDFFILRRFNSLNVRIALLLQDEIVVLENELTEIDERTSRRDSEDFHNGSFRQDQNGRTVVLNKIRQRMLKYTISPEEWKYLEHESDLFGVVQKDKTPLRRLIDHSRRLRTLSIWRLKNQSAPKDEDDTVSYYSDKRMDTFASSIIVGLGIILLLAPLWILYALKSSVLKLAVITVFVATFLIILSFAMVAKPFEALGATAAYVSDLAPTYPRLIHLSTYLEHQFQRVSARFLVTRRLRGKPLQPKSAKALWQQNNAYPLYIPTYKRYAIGPVINDDIIACAGHKSIQYIAYSLAKSAATLSPNTLRARNETDRVHALVFTANLLITMRARFQVKIMECSMNIIISKLSFMGCHKTRKVLMLNSDQFVADLKIDIVTRTQVTGTRPDLGQPLRSGELHIPIREREGKKKRGSQAADPGEAIRIYSLGFARLAREED
ncbi:hypothetical protein CHU98_g7302 [Xylaria longipes]|nr:hypothetical protein CHU98_g7302 [Xylaria longipes]